MNARLKNLMKMAKKIVEKSTYKKLSSIADENELKQAAEYAVMSAISQKIHILETKISHLNAYGKNVFYAENKLLLLKSKIKYLKIAFEDKELEKLEKLFDAINEEIKYVQPVKSI